MKSKLQESLPFGRTLAILAKSYYGALTKRLEYLEIERYYSILIFIESCPERCTQQAICDHLKIDKVSMVRIIDYLLQKKFIHKIQNPEDRREYRIGLTAKAIQCMPEIHKEIDTLNRDALKGLTKIQQKELYMNLCKVQQNLDQLPSHKIFINYKKSK